MKSRFDLLWRDRRCRDRGERLALRPDRARSLRRALPWRNSPGRPGVPRGEDAAERLERFAKGRAPGQQLRPLAGERRHPSPLSGAWPASSRTNLIRKPPARTSAARTIVIDVVVIDVVSAFRRTPCY